MLFGVTTARYQKDNLNCIHDLKFLSSALSQPMTVKVAALSSRPMSALVLRIARSYVHSASLQSSGVPLTALDPRYLTTCASLAPVLSIPRPEFFTTFSRNSCPSFLIHEKDAQNISGCVPAVAQDAKPLVHGNLTDMGTADGGLTRNFKIGKHIPVDQALKGVESMNWQPQQLRLINNKTNFHEAGTQQLNLAPDPQQTNFMKLAPQTGA
eukprot:gene5224-18453_t